MTSNGNEGTPLYKIGSWITSDSIDAQYLAKMENCGTSGGVIIETINNSYDY